MHSSDAHVVQIQALIKGHLHRQGEHKCQQKSEITIQVVSAETYLAKEFLPRCRCNAWFPGGSAQVQGAGARNKRGTPAPEERFRGQLWKLRQKGCALRATTKSQDSPQEDIHSRAANERHRVPQNSQPWHNLQFWWHFIPPKWLFK